MFVYSFLKGGDLKKKLWKVSEAGESMQDTYDLGTTDICVKLLLTFAVKRYLSLLTWRLYMSKYPPDNKSWTDWVWQSTVWLSDRPVSPENLSFLAASSRPKQTPGSPLKYLAWNFGGKTLNCFRAVKSSHTDSKTPRLTDFKTLTPTDYKTHWLKQFNTLSHQDSQTSTLPESRTPRPFFSPLLGTGCAQRSREGNLRRYSLQCSVFSVQCSVFSFQYTVCIVQCAAYSL